MNSIEWNRIPADIAACLLLAFASFSTSAQLNTHSAQHELSTLRVAEGYQVNLFAAEPTVIKPIQMQFDPQGRLWVLCTTAYPQIKPGEKPKDRLVVLEDTDGDGQADKSTDFASDLVIPTGLALGHGGAFIGQGTELIHLRDTDGDGQADQRRVILSGFGTGDSHQNINSFTWSPGGDLLFCQGHNIYSRIETFAGVKSLDRAGVWRFRPGTLELDSFFHESSGPLNPWGVVFDDWGQPFLADGCCIGLFYLLPVMVPNKPVEKYSSLWLGKKVCGVDILSGGHYSAEEQGDIVGGTFFNNSVSRWRITEDGSGFAAKELPPLIESTNRNFRIVDVKVGPDGAIYLADWYNPIVGHYQYSFRHPDRDQTHGRIWRVTKKDRPLVPRPKLVDQSAESLLEQLKAPENYTRNQARRLLGEIDAAKLVPALRQWLQQLEPADPQREHLLLEALMVFETRDLVDLELLKQLLQARDHRARAYATRVLGRWHARVDSGLDLLAVQVGDSHPRVRLEAVVALNSIPSAQAMGVALRAVDQPMDRFLEYALRQAVQGLKPYWGPDFAAGTLALQNHPKQLEFLIRADGSRETLQPLVKLIQSETLTLETRAAFLEILAKAGGPEELTLLMDPKMSASSDGYNSRLHARMLSALASAERLRKVRPIGDLAGALAAMFDQPDETLAAEASKLAGVWRLETLRSRLEQFAESGEKSLTLRQAAMEGIASLGGARSREVLLGLAGAALPERVRFAAVSRLAAVDFKQAAEQAAGLLASGSTETDPTELFSAFMQRTGGAEALAQSLRRKSPAPDAAKLGLRLMRSVGRQDAALVEILETASGLQNEFQPLSSEETAALVAEVRAKGDRKRGEAIFRRADLSCLACHSVENHGGHIGPDLNSIGTGQPVEFIIGAILTPNKEIKEGYIAFEVTTKSGETYQGYKIRESNGVLVMRDVLQNQELQLRSDVIRAQKALGSLMPAGLVNHLTRAEFRDLLRYLSELGTPVR
jgi:putative heme-binding domain-containing protein